MHTLTDISAFIAVFDESIHVTGMDIVFCIFGSLVFIALGVLLDPSGKTGRNGSTVGGRLSFGNENGKTRAGAKAAVVISTAVVIAFVLSKQFYKKLFIVKAPTLSNPLRVPFTERNSHI